MSWSDSFVNGKRNASLNVVLELRKYSKMEAINGNPPKRKKIAILVIGRSGNRSFLLFAIEYAMPPKETKVIAYPTISIYMLVKWCFQEFSSDVENSYPSIPFTGTFQLNRKFFIRSRSSTCPYSLL